MSKNPTTLQLAELYQVAEVTVEKWKERGMDVYSVPNLVGAVLGQRTIPGTWKELKQNLDGGTAKSIEEAKLEQVNLQNAKLKRELEMYDIRLIPKDVVEKDGAIIAFVIAELIANIRSECGPMLEGLTAAEIDEKVGPWMDEWEERLKRQTEEIWERAAKHIAEQEMRGGLKRARAIKNKEGE